MPARTMQDILNPALEERRDPRFPDAPEGWTPADAEREAGEMGLALTDDHWEAARVLQGCYRDEPHPRVRLLHDALEARFEDKGGAKYLFELFPRGPIAQGCRLAGLQPPPGVVEGGGGSVQ